MKILNFLASLAISNPGRCKCNDIPCDGWEMVKILDCWDKHHQAWRRAPKYRLALWGKPIRQVWNNQPFIGKKGRPVYTGDLVVYRRAEPFEAFDPL